MKFFLSAFPRNFIKIFSPRNLPWHALAIFLTYIIVMTGFDWEYFLVARTYSFTPIFFPTLILGGILPFLVPLTFIFFSRRRKSKQYEVLGWALLHAAILGSVISSIYKAITGRVQPNLHNLIVDSSHDWNFGFFNHGIFWGWPSSHTTIAFSMAITLVVLFRHNKRVVWSALAYALYIGIGVAVVSIHWLSEAVAGAIIGSVIGYVVGKSFEERFNTKA